METKANFLMIGLFTLAGIIGAFAFLLWFAKIEVDRQYNYYDILFENVAGLGTAGDVRYNGLPVGQVVDLAIDETDPSNHVLDLSRNKTEKDRHQRPSFAGSSRTQG